MEENNNNESTQIDPMDMSPEDFLAFIEEESSKPLILDEPISAQTTSDIDDEPVEEEINEENIKEESDSIEVVETDGSEETEEDIDIDQEQQQETEVDTTDNEQKTDDDEVRKKLEEYERLKKFEEALTNAKVDIDGFQVDGLKDPESIIQMQKKYAEMIGKVDTFEKQRPMLEALKKNGLLEDQKKLALVLEAAGGNPEAIKLLMKENEIDPLELDLETIDESSIDPSKHLVPEIEIKFNDLLDKSAKLGVEEPFVDNVVKKWDSDSITKLLEDETSKQHLLNHIKTGSFNKVQEEIKALELRDLSGQFRHMSDFDKYVIASNELAKRYQQQTQQPEPVAVDSPEPVSVKENEEVKKTVKVESKTNDRLKKAKKASKSSETVDKSVSKGSKKTDLMSLSDEEFLQQMYKMM